MRKAKTFPKNKSLLFTPGVKVKTVASSPSFFGLEKVLSKMLKTSQKRTIKPVKFPKEMSLSNFQ